ncbi:MAG TPA: hypothetical protein VHE30_06510 [Polyangiaceae bacterium]|nr:hypothetical protein [Polyangiaceae bacterium]
MTAPIFSLVDELREQRWDDHRYYHRSRLNQSLHLLSAFCFLVTYGLLLKEPIQAAIFGWCIAMWPRQIGHFFFEPKGYDEINDISFEGKEEVKVGYNLQRKVLLFTAWLSVPIVLRTSAAASRLVLSLSGHILYTEQVGIVWLWLAFAGFLGRVLFLCATRSPLTGFAWFTKILTDPFHDIVLYHAAPLHLLRGEWLDPMDDAREHSGKDRRSPR